MPSARHSPVQVTTDSGRVRRVPPVRVSHGKVAEMQRRGAVHFHVLLRLDGVDLDDRNALVPPPAGITVDDLDAAVHAAARQITVVTPPHPDRPQGWQVAWGEQVDVRRIGASDGDVTDGKVAAYLAKYATKSTEATETTGHCSTRLTPDTVDAYADPEGDHLARLIDACWRLGRPTHHHTARRYSVTFGLLRGTRATYRRAEHDDAADSGDAADTVTVGTLAFVGSGWLTDGDALLANTAATQRRERRRVGREELAHEAWSGVAA